MQWLKRDKAFSQLVQWRCVTGRPLEEDMASQRPSGEGVVGGLMGMVRSIVDWTWLGLGYLGRACRIAIGLLSRTQRPQGVRRPSQG